jgi:gluconolactonase
MGVRVVDTVGGEKLSAPNDLVFDRGGGLWFTDLGRSHRRTKDLSGLYYMAPGGGSVNEVSFGSTGYNGVGLSPDEAVVYAAETYTGRLVAFDLASPGTVVKGGRGGRIVGAAPGRAFFDSLAVQADGAVCVASIDQGITTMAPDGRFTQTPVPDRMVTNICFGGADMKDAYITCSGDGRLIRMRWPQPGLKLNFGG